jgi:general secretion pathway protein D
MRRLVNAQLAGRALGGLTAAGLAMWLFLTPASLPGLGSVPAWAEEEPSEIALTDEVTIEDFLRAVGQAAPGKSPIVWDPTNKVIKEKKILGSINLKAPPDKIFELVRALLTFYELAMVPVGPRGYEVNLVMDARQQGAILKLKPRTITLTDDNLDEYENQDGLFVSANIRVEKMTNLRDARQALSRIVTGQNIGNVTEVPASRSFVVTDFAPNVVSIYRLLRQLDVQPEGKVLTSAYVKLNYASADEIEPILTDLFTGRERVAVGRPAQPQPQGGGSSDIEEDPEPRIISDLRTNTLIIYATQDDIREIEEVISHLDVPITITSSRVNVIPLKNLEAEETATVLQSLIDATSIFGVSGGGLSTGRTGAAGRTATPRVGTAEVSPDQEEKPAVVADPKSNSLIIAASPRQLSELRRVIEAIDVKKSQVLIEAALIELTLDDAFRLAVELGMADPNGLLNDAVSGFGFTSYGQSVFTDKDGDTYSTDRIPPFVDSSETPAPTGLVGGIFAMGQMPLIFNIVNTITRSRILQLPSLVTADNEEAVIEVKDEQPTTQSSTTNGGVTNGGFGGFEDAGTTLQISPHIADNQYLLLNIRMQVSAFQGESRVLGDGTVIPPPRISRMLQTVVTVPDRHTVVLGGLMGHTERSTVDKVPWVGDLPVLGYLFKSTNDSTRQTSLFLFVTPTIMADTEHDTAFNILDRESCKRKQKADELIGYTDIYNSQFKGCDMQDCATGEMTVPVGGTPNPAGAVRGSGSCSDALDRCGALEASRFLGVKRDRLEAEAAHRRASLRRGAAPAPAEAPGCAPCATPAR